MIATHACTYKGVLQSFTTSSALMATRTSLAALASMYVCMQVAGAFSPASTPLALRSASGTERARSEAVFNCVMNARSDRRQVCACVPVRDEIGCVLPNLSLA
jgi:hypothetical protein